MPYKAKKCIRFDRVYTVGELIEDSAIDVRMEKYLIGMGLVERVDPAPASGADSNSNPKRRDRPKKGE